MSQPSIIDVVTPFDPTAYTTITGTQLQQFGSGINPYIDKGLVITTSDIAGNPQVPAANTTTKWQRYLWIRQLASSIIVYAWNSGSVSDPTYLNWIAISSISNIAGGSLTGTYPNPTLANSSVGASQLQAASVNNAALGLLSVGTANIQANAVTNTQLASNAVASGNIQAGAVGNTQLASASVANANLTTASVGLTNLIIPTTLANQLLAVNATNNGIVAINQSSINQIAAPSTANQAVVVNSGITGFTYQSPTKLGRVLQIIESSDTTQLSGITTSPLANPATLPTTANGVSIANLSATIIPQSIGANSTISVEAVVNLAMYASVTTNPSCTACIGLFNGNTCVAVAFLNNSGYPIAAPVTVKYQFVPGSNNSITFTFRLIPVTESSAVPIIGYNINGAQSGATGFTFGGLIKSWIKVTEYQAGVS